MAAAKPFEAWSLTKIKSNIENHVKAGNAKVQTAILLTTGALNPVHLGHVSMLQKAADTLREKHQIEVVGAYLSPSNDMYLAGKFGSKHFIPGVLRAKFVDLSVESHPFITTGRFEVDPSHRHWPDFPEVAAKLKKEVDANVPAEKLGLAAPPLVLYVSGEDHFSRCGLHRGLGNGIGVCVVARGVKKGMENLKYRVFAVDVVDETTDFSSTAVRNALSATKAPTIDELSKHVDPRVAVALVRLGWSKILAGEVSEQEVVEVALGELPTTVENAAVASEGASAEATTAGDDSGLKSEEAAPSTSTPSVDEV